MTDTDRRRAAMILGAVDDDDDRLSEWEQEFVASVREQFEDSGGENAGGRLSGRQCEKLEEIWEKV